MRSLKRRFMLAIAVRENVQLGKDVHVGFPSTVWAPRSLSVGDGVYIGKNVTIQVDGSIGPGTMIANNVGIVGRRDHDYRTVGRMIRDAPWVGDNPEELSLM